MTHIERISDQAKNICEETVFLVTGDEKPFKIYNVLFLDEGNNSLGPMAEVIARKAFPESGVYTSAGSRPAEALDPRMVDFMNRHGYDFTEVQPQPLSLSPEGLADLQVIVSLKGAVTDYTGDIPFHTVDLEWELPAPGPVSDDGDWQEIYQHLLLNSRQLMEALRGKEAP